jgi:hypothetical protein
MASYFFSGRRGKSIVLEGASHLYSIDVPAGERKQITIAQNMRLSGYKRVRPDDENLAGQIVEILDGFVSGNYAGDRHLVVADIHDMAYQAFASQFNKRRWF